MEIYRKELWSHVPSRYAFLNIKPDVIFRLKKSGIGFGQRHAHICIRIHQ
jgi:hypothetical protein